MFPLRLTFDRSPRAFARDPAATPRQSGGMHIAQTALRHQTYAADCAEMLRTLRCDAVRLPFPAVLLAAEPAHWSGSRARRIVTDAFAHSGPDRAISAPCISGAGSCVLRSDGHD